MMSKSQLELIGLQTVLFGLEMAARQANDNVSQARSALENALTHNGEVIDVAPARRGRPPAQKSLPAAPTVDDSARYSTTRRNWAICKEAGIPTTGHAPSREMAAKAWKIVAKREGISVDEAKARRGIVMPPPPTARAIAIGTSVKARWDLIRQAGLKLDGKGAPSLTLMEKARKIIARREKKAAARDSEQQPKRKKTKWSKESRAAVSLAAADRRQRCIEAGVNTNGVNPSRELIAQANAILATLCYRAGVSVKNEIPTLAEARRAKRILGRQSSQRARRPAKSALEQETIQAAEA